MMGWVNAASAGGASSWGVWKILKSRDLEIQFSAFSTSHFTQQKSMSIKCKMTGTFSAYR